MKWEERRMHEGRLDFLYPRWLIGFAALCAFACSEPEAPVETAPAPEPPVAAEAPQRNVPPELAVDVEGLPPLFPEGAEHPESPITLTEYFSRFGAGAVLDPETKKIRPEVDEALKQELVGKQVAWDGYVSQVRELPSGRVTLVLGLKPEGPGLDQAMVKFSAARRDQVEGYGPGDRVRVVAVFDKLTAAFPSLRGLDVERLEQTGLVSSEPSS